MEKECGFHKRTLLLENNNSFRVCHIWVNRSETISQKDQIKLNRLSFCPSRKILFWKIFWQLFLERYKQTARCLWVSIGISSPTPCAGPRTKGFQQFLIGGRLGGRPAMRQQGYKRCKAQLVIVLMPGQRPNIGQCDVLHYSNFKRQMFVLAAVLFALFWNLQFVSRLVSLMFYLPSR